MFAVRNHARAFHSPLPLGSLPGSRRWYAQSNGAGIVLNNNIYEAHGPVAQQLKKTKIWMRNGAHAKRHRTLDYKRVNLVGEELCDDILSYVGHSLDRHRGCDLIDLYPGAGVWSSKLHEYLQPRSHLLLEPDAKLYQPFLQPLLDKPGTTLIPKDGIVWRELNSILTPEFLPHQHTSEGLDPTRRNDTLLVSANLVSHPKKKFGTFDSIANLLLYQFVNAVRAGTLFHRYGQVRMLLWVRADDKQNFLPKNLQRRTKMGMEAELLCEWAHEICGSDDSLSTWFCRDENINHASLIATAKRMQALNFHMPAGRGSTQFEAAMKAVKANAEIPALGTEVPIIQKSYRHYLADLDSSHDETREMSLKEQRARLRARSDDKKHVGFLEKIQQLDQMVARIKSGATMKQIAPAAQEWALKLDTEAAQRREEFMTHLDNMHLFRQDPPALHWDRRHYEPMESRAEEFFPNIPGALLDIQPKAPHPLLRRGAPGTNDASNVFDIIFKTVLAKGAASIGPQLDALWPGAADYIMPRLTSARDWDRGGFLGTRHMEVKGRAMNSRQWEQIIELWTEWPFHPEFHELVGRTQEELEAGSQGEDTPADI